MSAVKVSKSKKEVESKVSAKNEPTPPPVETKPEPVEPVDNEVEEIEESKKVTFDELMETMQERYKELRQQTLAFGAMLVQVRRAHNQSLRQQSAKKKTRKAVVDSGILKPVPIPSEARAFLGDVGVAIPESNLMRRTELSGAIYNYIKANNLYKVHPTKENDFDRKVIIPDAKLRKLFSLKADQTLDFSSINVNLAQIYRRARELLEASNGSASAPAPAPAPAVAATPAKKGKVAGSSA
jgi:hypothetical protein